MVDFSVVAEFEKKIAEFFGAPYAVAVDSCTHGLELCLRRTGSEVITCPTHTYLSVPMLANKLHIGLNWCDNYWTDFYFITANVIDAAVFWKKDGYKTTCGPTDRFMCLSFQYQKHLSLGRGGMILCPNEQSYNQLKKMSYDGRLPGIPWRDQDIKDYGFHYYMQPEIAALGLSKLQAAIDTPPKQWTVDMWPDVSKMTVFNK